MTRVNQKIPEREAFTLIGVKKVLVVWCGEFCVQMYYKCMFHIWLLEWGKKNNKKTKNKHYYSWTLCLRLQVQLISNRHSGTAEQSRWRVRITSVRVKKKKTHIPHVRTYPMCAPQHAEYTTCVITYSLLYGVKAVVVTLRHKRGIADTPIKWFIFHTEFPNAARSAAYMRQRC